MGTLQEEIEAGLENDQLPCPTAFEIARRLKVKPLQVGEACDDMDVRLSRCQLGLFGYGPKAEGKHKIVRAAENVPDELSAALRQAVDKDHNLSCAAAWKIASALGVERLAVSGAAESLGLRIMPCQLGAFKK